MLLLLVSGRVVVKETFLGLEKAGIVYHLSRGSVEMEMVYGFDPMG